jgi:hypothetical protein
LGIRTRLLRALGRTAAPPPKMTWAVDVPAAGQIVPPSGFLLSGWAAEGAGPLARIVARHAGDEIGATVLTYVRDDVEPGRRCGYRMFVEPAPDAAPGPYDIELFAYYAGEPEREVAAGSLTCVLSEFDERTQHYGAAAEAGFTIVLHRSDVYSTGPPSRHCAPGSLDLLFSYIEPEQSVIDVGCGAAPYARPFLDAGRDWSGCEVRDDLVAENVALGLPVTLVVDHATLPFEPASFDFAICVEVLEHIDDYDSFVAEIARVARRGACFSVPNVRAVPRLAPLAVVPWHLLEATHINFFGVASLRELLRRHFANVDVFEYAPLPGTAIDGTPVFNQVFAVAMHA